MGSNRFQLDVPAYVQLYLEGRPLLDELISERLARDDLDQAWSALGAGEGARSVVIFD
ncbi:MAG: S-(hydroxymethyl)glutathione dehydrogenase / alcohol dehydrogenase [Solirubrobacteraceae bacterium]|nr:S-(hydroxymethyl)glutathione dehydrogenase / alcohol dehydrogenase [Solirubrobacteraceae bacterium]